MSSAPAPVPPAVRIQRLPLIELSVEWSYRKPADKAVVKALVRTLRLDGVGLLAVNRRPYGAYIVCDGWARVLAMRARHVPEVMIELFEGLTLAEEAHLYRLRNTVVEIGGLHGPLS
jgi:hypothetical protein